MRIYFDTSVLVAAMLDSEASHEACLTSLAGARNPLSANHTLAELFSTLTGGRLPIRLDAHTATDLIEVNLAKRLEWVGLSGPEYLATLGRAHSLGVRGGAIYDLLHLAAARKSKADRILTLNVRHFEMFAPDLKAIIAAPG